MKSVHTLAGSALISVALLMAGQSAVTAQDAADQARPEAPQTAEANIKVTAQKITDRNHPDYVRCRTERVIGSLAKKRKICMTNREWKKTATEGNRRATELIETHRAGSTSGS